MNYDNSHIVNYFYDSLFEYPDNFKKENFIRNIKVIPNKKEIVVVSNDDIIRLLKFDIEIDKQHDIEILTAHSEEVFSFKESHHLYDLDILYDSNLFKEDYLKLFFLCSKDNPIRVINKKGKIEQTYSLKNLQDELTYPVSLKIDQLSLNLYCGMKKYISKIDLVSDRITNRIEMKTSSKKEISYISCFDFKKEYNPFYLCGSYSGNIYLIDSKSDKIIEVLENNHTNGVNQLTFSNDGQYFLSGGRKDQGILLWDIRNLSSPLFKFYRNNTTNQKLNFIVSKNNLLFSSNSDGTILAYDMRSYKIVSYFYASEDMETVSSLDLIEDSNKFILISSTGTRHYLYDDKMNNGNQQRNLNINFDSDLDMDEYKNSSFKMWDFNYLLNN